MDISGFLSGDRKADPMSFVLRRVFFAAKNHSNQ